MGTAWMYSHHPLVIVCGDRPQERRCIVYTCSCPQFRHYHVCKHVIAFGLHQKTITVPLRFSSVAIGKRKAKAGASLSKRSRCLQIDN